MIQSIIMYQCEQGYPENNPPESNFKIHYSIDESVSAWTKAPENNNNITWIKNSWSNWLHKINWLIKGDFWIIGFWQPEYGYELGP